MVSQGGTNDNNNKGLKIAYLKFCLVFTNLFPTKKISFRYEVFVHDLLLCNMFYVYRDLSIMRNLRVKD